MRRQRGAQNEVLAIRPRFLMVPPELEGTARGLAAQINPTTVGDVNPWADVLEVIVEPGLSDTSRWYLAGDPASADGLAHVERDLARRSGATGEVGHRAVERVGDAVDPCSEASVHREGKHVEAIAQGIPRPAHHAAHHLPFVRVVLADEGVTFRPGKVHQDLGALPRRER